MAGDAVGEPFGDAVVTGLATVTGVGEAAGLFGTSGFGSQAPRTATVAARIVDNIILLIVLLLFARIWAR